MGVEGWVYYNHAAIPLCAPHETPNLKPIETGEIWKMEGSPLFARWTTDFDCEEKTNWWYNIKQAPFVIEELPSRSRKHIRQAQRKCYVKKIDPTENIEALYQCYWAAFRQYENAMNEVSYEKFKENCEADQRKGLEYWAGYAADNDQLIGYMIVQTYADYAELRVAKFLPERRNCMVSDALYVAVLEEYLNRQMKNYISSGTRSINHKTNTEEYKISNFAYKRAYCKLNICYNPKIKWIVKILYLFRGILARLDKISQIHRINAVLKMEEIVRNEEQ